MPTTDTKNFQPIQVYDGQGRPITIDADTDGNLKVALGSSDVGFMAN